MALTADETKIVRNLVLSDAALSARRAARNLCRQTLRYGAELPNALDRFAREVEAVKKNIDIANRI